MWWLMFFLGCDPTQIQKGSVSMAAGMTVIELQYALVGIPQNLSPDDRAMFMADVQSLHCSFVTNPPPGLGLLSRLTFLSTLESMWANLGGNPQDLGC